MKYLLLTSAVCGLVATGLFATRTLPAAASLADEPACVADPKWFPATPKPTFQKPDPDVDCDFYRPAWQYLLYLIQEEKPGRGPRLLGLDHPEDLFGRPKITRFPQEAKKGVVRLAPRLALQPDPLTDAEINQAGSLGILVDPTTRRAVYYSIHFNETFSDFIRRNHYDQVLNLKNAPSDQEFPRGSAEIKTSWRILPKGDPGDGYITAPATVSKLKIDGGKIVIDPSATETDKKVALLGIHVVFVLDGHPEFIWATFEHKNNAPELNKMRVEKPPGAPIDATPVDNTMGWSLYSKGTPANLCNKNNKGNPGLVTLNAADQTLKPVTNVFRQFHFGNDDNPDVIESLNKSVRDGIDASLAGVTDADAKERLAALKNYSLRGAMWLNNPAYFREGVDFAKLDEQDSTKRILGGDPQLSNAVIETFTQEWKPMMAGDTARRSQFCFDCHTTLAKTKTNPKTMKTATLPALRLNVSQTLVQRYFQAALP